jgi:hypothetical protein
VIGVEVVEWELESTKCNFNQKRELYVVREGTVGFGCKGAQIVAINEPNLLNIKVPKCEKKRPQDIPNQ